MNSLRLANWQLGGDNNAERPEPIMPPDAEQEASDATAQREAFRGGEDMTIDEMTARLGW